MKIKVLKTGKKAREIIFKSPKDGFMVPMKVYSRGMTRLYYTKKERFCHEILDPSDNVKKKLNVFF